MNINRKMYALHVAYKKHAYKYFCSLFSGRSDERYGRYAPMYRCSCGAIALAGTSCFMGTKYPEDSLGKWDCTEILSGEDKLPCHTWGLMLELRGKL
jgi:hypothetical protein